jgi:hypothetical protein
MTREEFDEVLKAFQTKADADGFHVAPGDANMTVYAAHGGAGSSLTRLEAVKVAGSLVFARNVKKDLFAVGLANVYAIGLDGGGTQTSRKPAGFG